MANRLVFLLKRKTGMSRDEFQAYWREHHAPLVRERAERTGIRRYQQVHTVGAGRREGTVPEFDGIAELWFDGVEPTGSVAERRQAGAELLVDERSFIDLSSSPIWMADEVVLEEGAGAEPKEGLRLTAALRRVAGTSRDEFRRHWRERHGPLALANADVFGFRRYVQLHTPDDAESFRLAVERGSPMPFDGLSEIWLDDLSPEAGRAAAVRAIIMEDEARFMDNAESPLWLGRVEVVVDR